METRMRKGIRRETVQGCESNTRIPTARKKEILLYCSYRLQYSAKFNLEICPLQALFFLSFNIFQ